MPDLALYEAGRKSLFVAYLLWFFLGLLGAHRFYARAGRTGWWLLALHLAGWTVILLGSFAGMTTDTQTLDNIWGSSTQTSVSFDGNGGVIAGIGGVLRGAAWLWWLADVILVPGLVRRWNMRLAAGLGMPTTP